MSDTSWNVGWWQTSKRKNGAPRPESRASLPCQAPIHEPCRAAGERTYPGVGQLCNAHSHAYEAFRDSQAYEVFLNGQPRS
jgi:hypothetical protein